MMTNTTTNGAATMPEVVIVPNREEGQSSQPAMDDEDERQRSLQDARFSCNICFDSVTEPVVTRCGHLYCWPCLYRWLVPGMSPAERAKLGMPRRFTPVDESRRVCPVCKSECSASTVVPIYVRNQDGSDSAPPPRQPQEQEQEEGSRSVTPPQPQSVEQRQESPSPTTSTPAAADEGRFQPIENTSLGLDLDDDDLGLDIDDDNPPSMIPTAVTTAEGYNIATASATTGLRQRRRNESSDESNTAIVPTRPTPSREQGGAATETNNSSSTSGGVTPRAPSPPSGGSGVGNHHATARLSHGLVLAMHQTLLRASNSGAGSGASTPSPDGSGGEAIPSLHYPQQRRGDASSVDDLSSELDVDPSTVFLSRLLLGLSLFVLFCLLAF